ncbi:serine hydrolase domain-containing protein [Agaribacterium sp. ZY112]|uniref:serine hydrolase domain-containing protein n=1 Tax=Agaribacterium sp. ZY112 TaxID=3233574 RepID=UPI0035251F98
MFVDSSFANDLNGCTSSNKISSLAQTLDTRLKRIQQESKLVAASAGLLCGDTLIGISAYGERKKGSGIAVSTQDLWHIGSITKSVTATLIARLIEQDKLQWQTRLAEIFPKEQLHPEAAQITIEQLAQHRSGLPANFSFTSVFRKAGEGKERIAARRKLVLETLKAKPLTPPGSTFLYSNTGYSTLGVVAEELMGQTWEQQIGEQVMSPITINNYGFGAPKDDTGKLSQPRGHKSMLGFYFSLEDFDNSPLIGPAGTLHMDLKSLLYYGHEHLKGEQGHSQLLSEANFKQLHKAELNNYASGWIVEHNAEFSSGRQLWHNGSNTAWYALLTIVPDYNAVMAFTSNDSNIELAQKQAWDLFYALIQDMDKAAKTEP